MLNIFTSVVVQMKIRRAARLGGGNKSLPRKKSFFCGSALFFYLLLHFEIVTCVTVTCVTIIAFQKTGL